MARPAWPPPTTATSNCSGGESRSCSVLGWDRFGVDILSPDRLSAPCWFAATAAAPAQLGILCTWCPPFDSSQTALRPDRVRASHVASWTADGSRQSGSVQGRLGRSLLWSGPLAILLCRREPIC